MRPLRELGRKEVQVLGSGLSCPPHSGNRPLLFRVQVACSSIRVNLEHGSGQCTSSGGKGIHMYRARTMARTLDPLASQQLQAVGAVTSIRFMEEEETQAQRAIRFAQDHELRYWI